jgi:predicted nucleic acid-binding protein
VAAVIDTSVWVDLFHPKTPAAVREAACAAVGREDAALCEPVRLELLRGVPDAQLPAVERLLSTVPLLPTPATVWADALSLARRCYREGAPVSSMDTLIAAICTRHQAELVTFDQGFAVLARLARFRLTVLARPSA